MNPPTRARTWGALALLTLAALVVRIVGIGYGLPCWEEPDPDIVGHVDLVRTGWTTAGVEHPEQQYPHLIADIARLLPARPDPAAGAPRTLEEHLHAASWTHLQVRWIVALIATLLVPATFVLARNFVSAGWSLFAAAMVASSLLHESFSQQARPHAAAATMFALALIADIALLRSGSWRAYLAAGFATALSLGVLHSGLATLLPGLLAHLLRKDAGARRLDWKLAIPIVLCAAAVYGFYPFLFDHSAPEAVGEDSVKLAEHAVSLSQFYGRGFRVVAQVMWNYEPVLTIVLGLAAVVWLVARKLPAQSGRGELWVALSLALPYLLAIGLFERTYERFVLPLLPYFAIFAAWALQRCTARISGRVAAACALLVLAVPAAATAKLAYLRHRPDTLDRVAQWLLEQPDATEQHVYLSATAPSLDLPLFRKPGGLPRKPPRLPLTPWSAWQPRVPDELAPSPRYDLHWLMFTRDAAARGTLSDYVASLGPAFVVVEPHEKFKQYWMLVMLGDALAEHGTRVARFSPDFDPESTELELFYGLSDHFNEDEDITWPHFTWRLLHAHAIGPVVEIWRIPAPSEHR